MKVTIDTSNTKVVWVNVYPLGALGSAWFDSREEAEAAADSTVLTTVPVFIPKEKL